MRSVNFYMPVQVYFESGCVLLHSQQLASLGDRALLVTGRSGAVKSGALEDVCTALKMHRVEWEAFSQVGENPLVSVSYTHLQGTASGRKPVPGIVAVDPSKIPYGTRMYIVSSDGSFVYGYAVAGETGSAMKEGRVDFDLLYATYAQSCAHGKRALDVYFLD